jgi:hypothetical protein
MNSAEEVRPPNSSLMKKRGIIQPRKVGNMANDVLGGLTPFLIMIIILKKCYILNGTQREI